MRFFAGVSRLLARTVDSFFGLSGYGLAGFFGFLSNGLSSLFGFLTYGLGGLFSFRPDGFGCLLRFLTYGFHSILNCFPCFLGAVLYFLTYPFLTKNRQHSSYNQPDDQARDFHFSFLLLITSYIIGSDQNASLRAQTTSVTSNCP